MVGYKTLNKLPDPQSKDILVDLQMLKSSSSAGESNWLNKVGKQYVHTEQSNLENKTNRYMNKTSQGFNTLSLNKGYYDKLIEQIDQNDLKVKLVNSNNNSVLSD
jgi:hypothetical protein